jgi:hypothetical protein
MIGESLTQSRRPRTLPDMAVPSSSAGFSAFLVQTLAAHGVEASATAEGDWPQLDRVEVTLVRVEGAKPPPMVTVEEAFRIEELSVRGAPVIVEGVSAHIEAQAKEVSAGFVPEVDGASTPVLRSAESVALMLEITKKELERTLHEVVSAAVEKQGAAVRSTVVEVSSPGPRTLEVTVHCTAKVFIATATLSVNGRVDIVDPLTLRISGLTVSGEGMIASMAQSFLRPRLDAWNDRELHLGAMLPGGLKLSDVRLSAGESVRIDAKFEAGANAA